MDTNHINVSTPKEHEVVLSPAYLLGLNAAMSVALMYRPDPAPDIQFRHMPADFGKHSIKSADFEVTRVAMKITGNKPEDAFLYVELTVKGNELSPIELHMPLPTCKRDHYINKGAIALAPDGLLPALLHYFQQIADTLDFYEDIMQ